MKKLSEFLTVAILAKNEEERIVKAIESVAVSGAKVLIVDSFSTDKTYENSVDTWQSCEREFIDFEFISLEWPGFVRARNFSIQRIKTRWVLWLDADEWLEDELIDWLNAHMEYLDPNHIYSFRRLSWFLGKKIKHGGWYPDYKKRLCRVGSAKWVSGPKGAQVHEDLQGLNSTKKIDRHIGHLPFRDRQEQHETNDKYSTLLAEALCEEWIRNHSKPFTKFYASLKVFFKFVENYFWKLGFLDGLAGFYIALGSSKSLALRIEKARLKYFAIRN